ncbi:nucleoside hydrolase [Aquirufa sp. Wall-65K1]
MKKLILLLLLVPFFLNAQSKKQKVIFDCDLGDDIDDAYALAYLLTQQDKLEILGITTCYGRTDDRARLALKMLYDTGQSHIPVFMGRNTSHIDKRANWYADQFSWAKGFEEIKPQAKPAADFIIEQIKKYPNEVVVFSVGPVTNFADIIQKDPQILKKAKHIYAMFGSFDVGYNQKKPIDAEWNVKVDVPASQQFVNSGAKITYAGTDVTSQVKLSAKNRRLLKEKNSPLTNALTDLYRLWGQETPTLFDPVAIAMLLHPDLFQTEKRHIAVDDQGFTRSSVGKSNAIVGIKIKEAKVLEILMDQYLNQKFALKP